MLHYANHPTKPRGFRLLGRQDNLPEEWVEDYTRVLQSLSRLNMNKELDRERAAGLEAYLDKLEEQARQAGRGAIYRPSPDEYGHYPETHELPLAHIKTAIRSNSPTPTRERAWDHIKASIKKFIPGTGEGFRLFNHKKAGLDALQQRSFMEASAVAMPIAQGRHPRFLGEKVPGEINLGPTGTRTIMGGTQMTADDWQRGFSPMKFAANEKPLSADEMAKAHDWKSGALLAGSLAALPVGWMLGSRGLGKELLGRKVDIKNARVYTGGPMKGRLHLELNKWDEATRRQHLGKHLNKWMKSAKKSGHIGPRKTPDFVNNYANELARIYPQRVKAKRIPFATEEAMRNAFKNAEKIPPVSGLGKNQMLAGAGLFGAGVAGLIATNRILVHRAKKAREEKAKYASNRIGRNLKTWFGGGGRKTSAALNKKIQAAYGPFKRSEPIKVTKPNIKWENGKVKIDWPEGLPKMDMQGALNKMNASSKKFDERANKAASRAALVGGAVGGIASGGLLAHALIKKDKKKNYGAKIETMKRIWNKPGVKFVSGGLTAAVGGSAISTPGFAAGLKRGETHPTLTDAELVSRRLIPGYLEGHEKGSKRAKYTHPGEKYYYELGFQYGIKEHWDSFVQRMKRDMGPTLVRGATLGGLGKIHQEIGLPPTTVDGIPVNRRAFNNSYAPYTTSQLRKAKNDIMDQLSTGNYTPGNADTMEKAAMDIAKEIVLRGGLPSI